MPLVQTCRIKKNELDFKYKINVTKEGMFSTTLPKEVVDLLKAANIDLSYNRLGNPGHFEAKTMEEVIEQIGEIVAEYFSRELIESKIVIKYAIETSCSYVLGDAGEIFPNGSYLMDKYEHYRKDMGCKWESGTQEGAMGLQVCAIIKKKEIFKYRSGKEKIEYSRHTDQNLFGPNGTYLQDLDSFHSKTLPEKHHRIESLNEIDYTEERAKFFVDLVTSICLLNEKIKDLVEPEALLKVIDNGQKILA